MGKGTCIEHMPHSDGNKGRIISAGYDNGIVRVLCVTADGIQILKSFKAHDDAIMGAKYSKDLKYMATVSFTGDVFFFDIDGHGDFQKYNPICTVKLPEENCVVTDFKWNLDDQSILISCKSGYVYQIRRPDLGEINNKDTYRWE